MPFTLKQVEAFHAVMSTGSATRAAEMLGVSQPAISRIVADFESSVGFPLFQRASRALVPTARARSLHAEVQRSFLGLSHIDAIAAGLRERGEGQLRLVVVPSLIPIVADPLIVRFARRHPDASVSVEISASLIATDWAAARRADLGITTEEVFGPGVEAEAIGVTDAACIMPAGHALASLNRAVSARELRGFVFVSYRQDSSFRAEVDRIFARELVARDLRFEARTTAAVCELVVALGGVAVVPAPGPHLAADARLAVRPFLPRLRSSVSLLRPTGAPSPPLARAFAEIARGSHRDLAQSLRASAKTRVSKDGA